MSPLNPKLSYNKRKEIIKNNIAFREIGERDQEESIAWICGVDRKTIYRDKLKMIKNGEWDDYIEETVLKLSAIGDISDETKFREFMKIYSKRFTEKHEIEANTTISYVIKKWSIHDEDGDPDTS